MQEGHLWTWREKELFDDSEEVANVYAVDCQPKKRAEMS